MIMSHSFSAEDHHCMQEAIHQSHLAEVAGEVPVGCVIVLDGIIIGRGHNQVISQQDPSAHAEMIALRSAAQTVKNYRLINSTIFVTLEPCLMCIGAIFHARCRRLVFATEDPKTGVCGGSGLTMIPSALNHHLISVDSGLYKKECAEILTLFFKNKRKSHANHSCQSC